jgi:hypothetical protein
MSVKTRTAVEVLVDLESKIDLLVGIVKSQDLQIKILSNKITQVFQNKAPESQPQVTPRFIITDGLDDQHIPMKKDNGATYIESGSFVQKNESPQETPRSKREETNVKFTPALLSSEDKFKIDSEDFVPAAPPTESKTPMMGSVPFSQRIITSTNKSVFMASIEVMDEKTNELLLKTRTNNTGRWSGSLPPGTYMVKLQKAPVNGIKKPIEIKYPITVEKRQGLFELKDFVVS